jgi:hypothetical protein
MYVFKQLICLVSLTVVSVTGVRAHDHNLHRDLDTILIALQDGLAPELSHICDALAACKKNDAEQIFNALQKEMPAIKPKFAYIVQHVLTQAQAQLLIDYLRDLHTLTATTIDDLMAMAARNATYASRDASNVAVATYCPKELLNTHPQEGASYAEHIAWVKEFEKVDLRDAGLNADKKFMCQCTYVLFTVDGLENSTCKGLLRKAINRLNKAIAAPYVIINDFYFGLGWEKEFAKTAKLFVCAHYITEQLLEMKFDFHAHIF